MRRYLWEVRPLGSDLFVPSFRHLMDRKCPNCTGTMNPNFHIVAWSESHGTTIHCNVSCASKICDNVSTNSYMFYANASEFQHGHRKCNKCGENVHIVYDFEGICKSCKSKLPCFPVCTNEPVISLGSHRSDWVSYDRELDKKIPNYFKGRALYCISCAPIDEPSKAIKTYLVAAQSPKSYLNLLRPELRAIIANNIIPVSKACDVCERRNVPMYGLLPRYGYSMLCLDCNITLQKWYSPGFDERSLAANATNRQSIPRFIMTINSRITKKISARKTKGKPHYTVRRLNEAITLTCFDQLRKMDVD